MPAKKKPQKPPAKTKSTGINLFGHVAAIKEKQNPKYFETLSDEDKKTWSNWMILRALSMNDEYLYVVNELQKYYSLPNELMYKLLIGFIPKRKTYDKFINGKKQHAHEEWLVDLIKRELESSKNEAAEYIDICLLTDEGKMYLLDVCRKYSVDEKEIKKLKLLNN